MANRYLPESYVEHIHRLALGVEPIDACRLQLVGPAIRIQVEDVPRPFVVPKRRADRCVYDIGLPALDRHPSNRHALLYSASMKVPVTIRLFDCVRWYVPRRLQIPILTAAQVLTSERAATMPAAQPILLPPQPPIEARMRRPVLYPGAAYQTDSGATALRARVFRQGQPLRWARVEGRDPASNLLLGRAHSDDRGEFLLIIGSVATPGSVATLADPVPVEVSVFGPNAAPAPDPGRATDPLWDVPLEVASFPGDPDPVSSGEVLPTGYVPSPSSTRVVNLPAGRITSAVAPFVFA